MKFVTFILIAALVAALGAGAYFYMKIYTPLKTDVERMKAGMPELDRAKAELKKYKAKETRETGWIPAAVETLQSALKEEIAAGKAEVAVSGNRVVVNISEQALFTPGSKTFSKDTTTLSKLPSLLKAKGLDDKEVLIGNSTPSVPAQGKGRKKVPAKDGRTLAGERSVELAKYLEKNGVNAGSLVATAYPPKPADQGFKIKEKKTMIVIEFPPAAGQETAAPKPAASVPAPAVKPTQQPKPAASAPQPVAPQPVQPKPIPVQPAQPKAN
jgi:hypothetical protein